MTFRLSPRLVYLLTSLLIAMASCKAGHPQTTVRFTPGQFWISGFGASPRIPLVGDVDGDGHADILSLNPSGAGEIDLARTSNLAKPVFPFQARSKFGGGALIAAGAPFSQQERSEVIALLPDGSLHLAHTYNSELRTYENDTTLLVLPKTLLPTPPLLATTGDFDGDHRTDWLVLDSVGRLFLFQNQTGVDGIPRFAFRPIRGKLAKIRQLASGDLNGLMEGASLVHRTALGEFFGLFTEPPGPPGIPPGCGAYFEIPVFNWFDGHFSAIYQRQYIDSAQRLAGAPRLSAAQIRALDQLDALANDTALHFTMALAPGDIQFVHNHSLFHDRTAFEDWLEPQRW